MVTKPKAIRFYKFNDEITSPCWNHPCPNKTNMILEFSDGSDCRCCPHCAKKVFRYKKRNLFLMKKAQQSILTDIDVSRPLNDKNPQIYEGKNSQNNTIISFSAERPKIEVSEVKASRDPTFKTAFEMEQEEIK